MAERRAPSLRLRITAVTAVVITAVLVLGAVLFVAVLRDSLVSGVRSLAETEASAIADRLDDADSTALTETEVDADDRLVQVIQGGEVVAFSDDAKDLAPLAVDEGVTTRSIPDEDAEFAVAAEHTDSVLVVVARDLSDVDESIAAAVPVVGVSIPILVALLAIIIWVVVGRALRPVERMRAEVDEVTANRLDRRIAGAGTSDELGRLATTMNRMLDRLDESQRQQRRFISDASHELKSPLASLRQYSEVARRYPDRMTAAELAEAIDDEGGRLEGIVRGMLVLARADEGSLGGDTQTVDLDDIVLAELQRLRASTALTVDGRVEPFRIQGGELLLGQVVRNLVDNAARHAHERMGVHLTAEGILTVDDDGNGITEADRERIFERFVRLDDGRARDAGGSGLGLAIVREIVTAHGGSVAVTDSPLGGARFTVRLG